MPRYRVIPYRGGSRSATALSRALGGLCLKVDGTSRFRPRHDDVIINWGSSNPPIDAPRILNRETANVSNKLTFFQRMAEQGLAELLPEFWTDQAAIPQEQYPVVARTVLNGHSGAGIHIVDSRNDRVEARLYTKYIKKQDEYRIHVGRRGEQSIIISTQQKRRRHDHENPNWQVRNHANGFIYARGAVDPPACVLDAARRVLEASGLDFGAVDVIYNRNANRAYVLEINTAPGLEGQTVDDYAAFFRGQ